MGSVEGAIERKRYQDRWIDRGREGGKERERERGRYSERVRRKWGTEKESGERQVNRNDTPAEKHGVLNKVCEGDGELRERQRYRKTV